MAVIDAAVVRAGRPWRLLRLAALNSSVLLVLLFVGPTGNENCRAGRALYTPERRIDQVERGRTLAKAAWRPDARKASDIA